MELAITEEQAARIAILAASRKARKHGIDVCKVCIDNPRIVAELNEWGKTLGMSRSWVVQAILWDVLFPGEKNPVEQQDSAVKLIKVCPNCGSTHILEPKNRFPLQWECLDCKAAFEQPVWGEKL